MNQLRLFLTDIKVSPHCVSQIGVLIKQSKKVVSAIKAATSPARNYWDTFGAPLTAAKLWPQRNETLHCMHCASLARREALRAARLCTGSVDCCGATRGSGTARRSGVRAQPTAELAALQDCVRGVPCCAAERSGVRALLCFRCAQASQKSKGATSRRRSRFRCLSSAKSSCGSQTSSSARTCAENKQTPTSVPFRVPSLRLYNRLLCASQSR